MRKIVACKGSIAGANERRGQREIKLEEQRAEEETPSLPLSLSPSPVHLSLPSRYVRARSRVQPRAGVDVGANTSGSRTRVKKKAGARERFAELLPYREDVDIFFTCNERECRERHAFDWPGGGGRGRWDGEREGIHGGCWWKGPGEGGGRRGRLAWVDHPLPSIFRGFFLRATALACLDERTRGGTSIIYNQTADKATIALL